MFEFNIRISESGEREREREREGERHHDIIALFYLICVLPHQKLPVNIKPVSISLFMTWF